MKNMRIPLALMFLGVLSACSGIPPSDVYHDSTGKDVTINSDKEQCVHSCNDTYSVCMESYAAQNSGVNGPAGMFGGSADCRNNLQDCLPGCKAR